MSKKWKRKNDKYRYSTFDNLGYLYAGAAKWQPFILWCTFFFALTTGLKNFVWIYGGKRIIDVLEKTDLSSRDFSAVFWIVVAALDPVAEYEVYRHFHDLVGGKTAVYISHRLSSCKFCDRIAVFAEHTIKEYGTHEELLQRENGIYATMFRAQAQYYVDA